MSPCPPSGPEHRLTGGGPSRRDATGVRAPTPAALRPVATALLLCAGMLVIPLVALGASGGAAARPAPIAAGRIRSRAAGSPRLPRLTTASAAVAPVPATLLEVHAAAEVGASPATFTTPLAVAAAAPAAAAPAAARASLLAKRPPAPAAPVATRAVVKVVAAPRPNTPPPVVHAISGVASWYYAPHGTCAHQTLPFGTILTIVDVATGRSATCRVDDRGPYAGGRVVDLAPDVFAKLEALGDGVAHVRITW